MRLPQPDAKGILVKEFVPVTLISQADIASALPGNLDVV
jgi:hypothetical protein